MELQLLPPVPEKPEVPEVFRNMSVTEAEEMLGTDVQRYELLNRTKPQLVFLLPGAAFALLGAAMLLMQSFVIGGIGLAVGLVLLTLGISKRKAWLEEAAALVKKYGTTDADAWTACLQDYREDLAEYVDRLQSYRKAAGDLDVRMAQLKKERESLCGEQLPEKVLELWQQVLRKWEERDNARREVLRTQNYLQTMQAMAKPAQPPQMADALTYTGPETDRLLSDARQEQQRLLGRLGQYQGRMEALGDSGSLQKQLDTVNARIRKLEDTYAALTIGLDTLAQAKLELQRRFAPRIANRAKELMAAMTGGRYDRLTLAEDLSLHAGAQQEDTLHEALWRSDGTVDQLYLALRLAVAEELTPDAPLILDDALVRFDDTRMKSALEIMRTAAERKQVILFTCQKRETEA